MAKPKLTSKDQVLSDMGESVEDVKEEKQDPLYRIMGESKVPVAKAFGKSIEKRKSAAAVAYEFTHNAWNEAYRYYNHNQTNESDFRTQKDGRAFRSDELYENIVFSNVSTMIPAIYAKNPDVSFNTDQDEDRPLMKVLTKAVNALFRKKPGGGGINLKPRMKKAALHAELTNMGIVKLEYIKKDPAKDKAEEEMGLLVEQLEKADDSNEVREIEGRMKALESQMELFEPSGFKLSTVHPHNLMIDVFAENEDGSDAWWMLEMVFLPTDWLNARFTEQDKDTKDNKLIYKPTHKVKFDGQGNREDMLGNVLETIDSGAIEDSKAYNTEQRQSYIYQNMTKCWYYWDRTTKRIYLFADNDWTWPIWVWNDDLGTSRFFPYHIFQIIPSTGGVVSPGEVSYYLDQQDEINIINEQIHRIRKMVFNFVLFNKNKITPDDAAKLIAFLQNGTGKNAIGVDVPEGMAIKDSIEAMAPPSINYKELFDKSTLYQAVDKIGSVSDAIRGTQFKAGTVKGAVESYQTSAKIRIGNRTDAIEDCVADIAWSVAEIMISQISKEEIVGLIGDLHAKEWRNMTVAELNSTTSVEVAAGSSEKPTSAFKKDEAVKITQAIGQFAKAAPAASLKIMLKLLQGAFPELDISEEDWNAIGEEASAMLGKGQNVPGAMPGGGQPQPGQPPGQPPAPNGAGGGQIEQILSQLPPQLKQMVVQAVQNGATPEQALQPILEKMHGRA